MGLGPSKASPSDIEHYHLIITQCEQNKNNKRFLVNLLRTEWTNVINKYNAGKLCGFHLNNTTCIISTINDINLNPIYRQLITNWNKGEYTTKDYNNVSRFIENM